MIRLILFLLALNSAAHAQWKTDCHVIGESDYVAETLTITNKNWDWTTTAFEDEACTTPFLDYQVLKEALRLDATTNQVDWKIKKVSYRAKTDEVARALSESQWCGISRWSENQWQEVTGKTCSDFSVPKKNQLIYSLVKIETEKLWIGTDSPEKDGSTSPKRHSNYRELPFIK